MLVDSDLRVAGDVLRKNGHILSDTRETASMGGIVPVSQGVVLGDEN